MHPFGHFPCCCGGPAVPQHHTGHTWDQQRAALSMKAPPIDSLEAAKLVHHSLSHSHATGVLEVAVARTYPKDMETPLVACANMLSWWCGVVPKCAQCMRGVNFGGVHLNLCTRGWSAACVRATGTPKGHRSTMGGMCRSVLVDWHGAKVYVMHACKLRGSRCSLSTIACEDHPTWPGTAF